MFQFIRHTSLHLFMISLKVNVTQSCHYTMIYERKTNIGFKLLNRQKSTLSHYLNLCGIVNIDPITNIENVS